MRPDLRSALLDRQDSVSSLYFSDGIDGVYDQMQDMDRQSRLQLYSNLVADHYYRCRLTFDLDTLYLYTASTMAWTVVSSVISGLNPSSDAWQNRLAAYYTVSNRHTNCIPGSSDDGQ